MRRNTPRDVGKTYLEKLVIGNSDAESQTESGGSSPMRDFYVRLGGVLVDGVSSETYISFEGTYKIDETRRTEDVVHLAEADFKQRLKASGHLFGYASLVITSVSVLPGLLADI